MSTCQPADRVLVSDVPVNALHIEIDALSAEGWDLRVIVAMKIDTKRVGEVAIDIAEASRQYVTRRSTPSCAAMPRPPSTC